MATYKVIQDIEAEDKLVGPFSLRQFIYAAIALFTAFIGYKFGALNIFLIIPFVPVVALFGVLAAPFGRDQPSEIWLLAKIRFVLKPHLRIWNQDGAINLVTVTAPKEIHKQLTNNLSSQEVTSRLQALANTIDTRGWAIKNLNVNLSTQNPYEPTDFSSQRLIDPQSLPQDVPDDGINAADDIMDPQNNPTARHLDEMMNASDSAHHAKVVASVTKPAADDQTTTAHPDYWFMNNTPPPETMPPNYSSFYDSKIVAPGSDESEFRPKIESKDQDLLSELERRQKEEQEYFDAHSQIIPESDYHDGGHLKKEAVKQRPPVTEKVNADIITPALAESNNWSVQTQAKEAKKKKEPPQDEVVVSFH